MNIKREACISLLNESCVMNLTAIYFHFQIQSFENVTDLNFSLYLLSFIELYTLCLAITGFDKTDDTFKLRYPAYLFHVRISIFKYRQNKMSSSFPLMNDTEKGYRTFNVI
jgi:hypothetical protein